MTVGVPSAILASVVTLTVTVAVLLRRPRRALQTRFAALSFTLFLWYTTSAVARFGGDNATRLQLTAALLIAPAALSFFSEILREQFALRRLLTATQFITAVLVVAAFSPWGTHLAFRGVVTVFVVGAIGFVLHILFTQARNATLEAERKRMWYLVLGGLAALVFGLGELVVGAELAAAIGHVAGTAYVYFLYQSVLSRRVIDLVDLVGKAAVLGVLTVVLASIYALLLLWVGTPEPELWLFNTLVASFVILILYDQIRPWVEETAAKLLFRQRYELRRAMGSLLAQLRTTISIDEMTSQVLNAIRDCGHTSCAAVYLASEGEVEFRLEGCRDVEAPEILTVGQQPALLQQLRREHRPIAVDSLADRYRESPDNLTGGDPTTQRDHLRIAEAIETMRSLDAQVVLPMLYDDHMLGILTIGSSQSTGPFSTEEIADFLSVAEACAFIIANSQEYERMLDRDRLVAVGEMAAGIAHEIRNPLGAIKGAAQCLDPATLPAEAIEFVNVIVEETDRLGRVLGQFLEYTRPYRDTSQPTDVNEVVTSAVSLLSKGPLPPHVELTVDLAHSLPKISIDPEHLKQILINLIHNAIEAMPNGGQVTVSTAISRDATGEFRGGERGLHHDHTVIRVHDTGTGIKSTDLPRLFVPFFTTRPRGTGLGLAISARLAQNAGGRIDVSSRPGHGTTFSVRLPHRKS
ncbi:MAG: hypothetical protein A2289_00875 [Deltaproteobacteria bacterium RIFOXYA12_FULL_58_15]|nr:MAG: hypothetical protein A2289_00875 [Deltaproteobacteria bacterium RIFOXYA12_FULL_58_15]OGR11260.1 MAG: hypothetical protein A2341_17630 [Deltaproteobacteria bacterium RIFOXYB12_FULL_58_9]